MISFNPCYVYTHTYIHPGLVEIPGAEILMQKWCTLLDGPSGCRSPSGPGAEGQSCTAWRRGTQAHHAYLVPLGVGCCPREAELEIMHISNENAHIET